MINGNGNGNGSLTLEEISVMIQRKELGYLAEYLVYTASALSVISGGEKTCLQTFEELRGLEICIEVSPVSTGGIFRKIVEDYMDGKRCLDTTIFSDEEDVKRNMVILFIKNKIYDRESFLSDHIINDVSEDLVAEVRRDSKVLKNRAGFNIEYEYV